MTAELIGKEPGFFRRFSQDVLTFFLAALLAAIMGWVIHGPAGRDDVYKTYWPAHTLATTGEIVNYNGEAMEQSSSLLQVAALALLHRVSGLPLPDIALALGIISTGLGALMVRRIFVRLNVKAAWLSLAIPVMPPLVYWAWSGMETALAAFICAWFLLEMIRLWDGKAGWRLFPVALAMQLVRPEFGVVMVLATVALLAVPKGTSAPKGLSGRLLAFLGLSALLSVMLALVRLQVTGSWMPQPVIAKEAGLEWGRIHAGAAYLWHLGWQQPVWIVFFLGGLGVLMQTILEPGDRRLWIPLALTAALAGTVLLAGADWMENGRLMVPVIPAGMVLFGGIFTKSGRNMKAVLLASLFGACVLGGLDVLLRGSTGTPAWARIEFPGEGFHWTERMNRIHARDIEMVERLRTEVDDFHRDSGRPPVIVSQQAGMVMYHLSCTHFGKFRFVDLAGLCSRDFTDCTVTRSRGSGWGGVNMDLFYLLDDLVRLEKQCGFPVPDIIFDLDHEDRAKQRKLNANGYSVVWHAEGVMNGEGWGMVVERGQFIARRIP